VFFLYNKLAKSCRAFSANRLSVGTERALAEPCEAEQERLHAQIMRLLSLTEYDWWVGSQPTQSHENGEPDPNGNAFPACDDAIMHGLWWGHY